MGANDGAHNAHMHKEHTMFANTTYKGFATLTLTNDDTGFEYSFGVKKARLILENIDAIRAFVAAADAAAIAPAPEPTPAPKARKASKSASKATKGANKARKAGSKAIKNAQNERKIKGYVAKKIEPKNATQKRERAIRERSETRKAFASASGAQRQAFRDDSRYAAMCSGR